MSFKTEGDVIKKGSDNGMVTQPGNKNIGLSSLASHF